MSSPKGEHLPIARLSTERLFEEVDQYLKTLRSDYFRYEPYEDRGEAILREFESSNDEHLRNNIREALCLFLQRERFFELDFILAMRVLDLVSETKATQSMDFLLDLARKDKFPGFTSGNQLRLKSKILSILMKFPLTQVQLRELIEHNISTPGLAEICLTGTIRLVPRIETFIEYLSKALSLCTAGFSKTRLDRSFIALLAEIGRTTWMQRGPDIMLGNRWQLGAVMNLMVESDLEPRLIPVPGNEYVAQLKMKWPDESNETVDVLPFALSAADYRALRCFIREDINHHAHDGIRPVVFPNRKQAKRKESDFAGIIDVKMGGLKR
jgi:hypothetical protein